MTSIINTSHNESLFGNLRLRLDDQQSATVTDDSDTSTIDGSTLVSGDTSMVNCCTQTVNDGTLISADVSLTVGGRTRTSVGGTLTTGNGVGGGHIKLQCSASSDAALSLTRRVHRQDFTSAGHEQPRL
jgi:hypothetical protein